MITKSDSLNRTLHQTGGGCVPLPSEAKYDGYNIVLLLGEHCVNS